jgi:hypothetical protein
MPAAVGLLCVGFWRWVGASTVFGAGSFFYFFSSTRNCAFFVSKSSFVFSVKVQLGFFFKVQFEYTLSIFRKIFAKYVWHKTKLCHT